MHLRGQGAPVDLSLAFHWFLLAADQGNPEAAYQVGMLYALGKGVAQDNDMAMRFLQYAANRGKKRAVLAMEKISPGYFLNRTGISANEPLPR
jgi:uncharacterized protein